MSSLEASHDFPPKDSVLPDLASVGLAGSSLVDLVVSSVRAVGNRDLGVLLAHLEADLGVYLAAENLPLIPRRNQRFRQVMATLGALSGATSTAMLHTRRRELYWPAVALGTVSLAHGAHQFLETHTTFM